MFQNQYQMLSVGVVINRLKEHVVPVPVVVLGTTTNIRFLRELCDEEEGITGHTDTTTIDRLWPNGWAPSIARSTEDAALMAAAIGESAGLHRSQVQVNEDTQGPTSPFSTLNRRYP